MLRPGFVQAASWSLVKRGGIEELVPEEEKEKPAAFCWLATSWHWEGRVFAGRAMELLDEVARFFPRS